MSFWTLWFIYGNYWREIRANLSTEEGEFWREIRANSFWYSGHSGNWPLLRCSTNNFSCTDKLWCLWKAIAHSIQSCFLYLIAKFQGFKTNRTRATSNFLRLFKTGNYFCGIIVCDVSARLRRFEKTFCHGKNTDIQDYAPARNVLAVFLFRMSKKLSFGISEFQASHWQNHRIICHSPWIKLLPQQPNVVFLINTWD